VASFFGAQDLEVGDEAFDDSVVVKGMEPHEVIAFLTPERRQRLLGLLRTYRNCTITDREICYSRRGTERDTNRLCSAVKRLVQTARSLRGEDPDTTTLDTAIQAQRAGRLDDALAAVRERRRQEADDVEAQVLEGEILYTGGRYQEAASVLGGVSKVVPEDEEVESLAFRARALARQPAGAQAASGTVDFSTACRELFDDRLLSFEAQRVFEERYQGRTLRWRGMLQQCGPFTSDLVFGEGPGTRVVLQLDDPDTEALTTRAYQAIVALPPEREAELRGQLGQQLSFAGTLLRCDPFMRNLYVDGRG
jgi:hypothetical protein